MSQEPAFKVTLECKNCGAEWDRDVEAGVKVENKTGGVEIGFNNWESCPVCELNWDVRVTDRTPLENPT